MTEKENKRKHKPWGEDVSASKSSATEGGADQEAAETVTLPLKDYAAQLEEVDDLKKKVDDFSDGWQRERADFDNYRKRIARDQEMEKQNRKFDILRKYLEISDDLNLAIKNMPEHVKSDAWVNGILLIKQKLDNLLDGEGLQPIQAENCAFDPVYHEAISSEEHAGFESGQIFDVVQQGYTIGDRVIRPARVRVAK